MRIETEEFISRFHSINGTTIAERRKNLFLLLNQIEPAHSSALDFSQLIPKTPLEEKFKVETLIYFKRVSDLLQVLKSENLILIERILDVGWFLEEAFQNISEEYLVTLIFPYISFNAKVKLLNKLSLHLKNPQLADAYFHAIEKKYGFYLASKIISACSPTLIIDCLKFRRITLTPRQLLAIIKKNPEITESILKVIASKKIDVKDVYKNIFLHLSEHDMKLFYKLYKKYELGFRLGWRKTRKFVQENKQDVINNPKKYYKLLHNKQIAKSVNRDFHLLYRNLFPKSLQKLQSSDQVFTIINKLPKKMKNVNLLFTTFADIYGSQLWDHEEYRDLKLLKMLPPNEREVITKLNCIPRHVSEEEWHSYKKTEISIPYLKKTISLTSDIGTRVDLVRLLVQTCYLNDDKIALLNMCKYMLKKHRNDNVSVRRAFLEMIQKKFILSDLGEEHWNVIHELLQIFTLNKESYDEAYRFFENYIHFCLKNNLPIKEHLIEWLKTYCHCSLNIIKTEPKYEKQCLLMFGEIIPELFRKENEKDTKKDVETELDKNSTKFAKALISWNEKHPEDQISIYAYPYVMNKITGSIEKANNRYELSDVVKYCLQLKIDSEQRKKLLNLYLTRSSCYLDMEIIIWLVQNEPLSIISNIDNVTLITLESYTYRIDSSFLWKWMRNYKHLLECYQKVINICLAELQSKGGSSVATKACQGLSFLMTGEEFKTFITPYYPSGLRADAKTEENETIYYMQKDIGLCLRHLNAPSLALESILIFCKGDYLKLIQRSLYSICSNVNEDKLVPFFNELTGRAVSVRKHAMHLTLRTLDKEQIFTVLNKFMETEKNASVRKFIFKSVFNFFVLNPDDYSWELFKSNVQALDINDDEAMEILMESHKIPLQYLARYIVFTFNVLYNMPDSNTSKNPFITSLIRSVTSDVINLLPKEFCNELIEKYFFKGDDPVSLTGSSDIIKFTCIYIIYCNSSAEEQEERLKLNFELIRKFISATWHKYDGRYWVVSYVGKFLKDFSSEFLDNKCKNTEILIKFSSLWNGLFKAHQTFDEYLHLQFTLICVQNLTLPQTGQKLAQLFDSLANIYEFSIVSEFAEKIKSFTQYFITDTDESLVDNWYVLIENLIPSENSIYCLTLAVLLLTEHKPNVPNDNVKYLEIINMVEKNPHPVVQLYLANHLKVF